LIDETSIGREFREFAGLTEDRLPQIVAPVLALYGETSPYIKLAAHLSEVLPNCRHETLPDDGHFYLLREPGTAFDRISGFLSAPAAYIGLDQKPVPSSSLTQSEVATGTIAET
jgi:pimeloyl-ACP methyl ester carboxylesterase